MNNRDTLQNNGQADGAEMLASLKRKEEQFRILNSFAVSLIQITNIEDLAWYVAKEVVGRLGFVDCVFYEYDANQRVLVQRAAIGEKNPEGRTILNPLDIPLGRGVTGSVAKTGKPELIDDVSTCADYVADIAAPGSELCVPLLYGREILGVIDCEDPRIGHFTDEHLDVLLSVASLASSKLAECRVLRQLQGQAQVLSQVREAVVVTDIRGNLTECNDGAAALFGASREALIGTNIAGLMANEGSWRYDRANILHQIGATGEWRGFLDLKTDDGEPLTVDASLTILTDEAGRRTAVVGVARDVTDLLRAERAILEKNEALERKQIELEKALIEGEAARRANRAKDAFLANTSHELRTPLAGVIGMIDLLGDEGLTEKQQKLVETANVSAHTLLTIIDDILDLAKMEAGTLSLRASEFDPNDLVEKAAATLRPAAEMKGLSLNVHLADNAPKCALGDASRIRQVLFNLIGNAVKFTDEGHVDVSMSFRPDGPGVRMMLEVKDTGPGFSASEAEKIFGRFEQLDGSATKSIGGTGLGLSISRELAHMMRGTLEATGKPGVGATFVLSVPLRPVEKATDDRAVSQATKPALAAASRKLKVLVAEDNNINQILIVKLLERYDWELKLVSNGLEAFEALDEADDFDLILMDIRMPVMDGVDATILIRRRRDAYASMPIIALTANTMENDKKTYAEAGIDAVVGKPVDRELLINTIDDVLAAKHAKAS
ncbi:ATP-binding protein [Kordiimonas sp.]|uniref:ATP-binding protein n=1 Tax=Kordiimonas sp. TaxID=1970157 RepID=UPI003A90F74D